MIIIITIDQSNITIVILEVSLRTVTYSEPTFSSAMRKRTTMLLPARKLQSKTRSQVKTTLKMRANPKVMLPLSSAAAAVAYLGHSVVCQRGVPVGLHWCCSHRSWGWGPSLGQQKGEGRRHFGTWGRCSRAVVVGVRVGAGPQSGPSVVVGAGTLPPSWPLSSVVFAPCLCSCSWNCRCPGKVHTAYLLVVTGRNDLFGCKPTGFFLKLTHFFLE